MAPPNPANICRRHSITSIGQDEFGQSSGVPQGTSVLPDSLARLRPSPSSLLADKWLASLDDSVGQDAPQQPQPVDQGWGAM
jgi:hypothetical protein